jgi:hypothetical protein
MQSFGIEADEAFSDRLGMTAQLLGDDGRPFPLPTPDDHSGAQDPIGWSVTTACQFPDLVYLFLIQRRAGEQELGHGGLLRPPA